MLVNILKRIKFDHRIVITIFALLSIVSVGITYGAIARVYNKHEGDLNLIVHYLISNIVFFAITSALVVRALSNIIKKNKVKLGTTKLQRKIVTLFTLIALVPTVLVSIFSIIIINTTVKAWFHDRIKNAIDQSVAVAELYLSEHKENIRSDILFIANDIDRQFYLLANNREVLREYLELQSKIRGLSEIVIFQNGKVVGNTSLASIKSLAEIPKKYLTSTANGDLVVISSQESHLVRSIIKLQNFFDSYVVVGRFVDEKALSYINQVKGGAKEYKQLMKKLTSLRIAFTVIFCILLIIILLTVILYGIIFGINLTTPIVNLIETAEKVASGNYNIRAKEEKETNEIATLSQTFNLMIERIAKQQSELIVANDRLDEKIRFNEKVLTGVSAGIIALNEDLKVQLVNPAAALILGINNCFVEMTMDELSPEISEFIRSRSVTQPISQELEIQRKLKRLMLSLTIIPEILENKLRGYVITFDDITELVAAQRAAAWSDVARRIAHEMKNPLTPIKLAADRLRKKYSDQVSDKDNFQKYISTISTNVENINKMVSEFVNFARIPEAKLKAVNIIDVLSNVIFTEQSANDKVFIEGCFDKKEIIINADSGQLYQTFLNIIRNSIEALMSESIENPKINIKITENDTNIIISIIDNGSGFDSKIINRLTEPYMTTKVNGSGLGLAIVKKIVEDHAGTIKFSNNVTGGANVEVVLPK
ncbi:sensor histidine kinase NtrY-like [Rickettsiales endosymbiont of Stachyamoeba lipophora]|uniref:sensor histidine kinase NtrY-like n=1 Tax=Rickettsiales endosymbiont of Stachyamoeba lipophora TaxID=2486578 RepID=UPI000F6534ED|nr:ATP-binding protein [Rickettsiales endosymbiont of Stachyamoeba lipophora]AZL15351.1 HAMP domain-containing protein [Rickettsiales endosymbiont of Stachyamoeba lipophora]